MSRACVLLVLALAAGCGRAPAAPIELAVPGRANAHVTLAADGGRVGAAWAASGDTGTDIYAAFSADAGRTFGAPVRVNDVAGDASANGEQPPRILLKGTAIEVLWVSKRGGVAAIRAASSADGGRTFAAGRAITPAGLTGARGWESAALTADGTVHAVWLDGRNAVHAPAAEGGAAPAPHQHGAMRQDVYHAMWRGSAPPVETPVAADVCFCCKTAIVTRGADVFVAWRHLFPGGVRDIAVARSADGGRTFGPPVRVSADNWKIDACPDDGPALTRDPDGALRVVWPTLVTGDAGPRLAIFESSSRDGGVTFAPRVRVDAATGGPAHPRIAGDDAGRTAVVWDEMAEGSRQAFIRPAGGRPEALSTGRADSYPAVAGLARGFVAAWTDQSGGRSVVRVRRVP